MANRFWILGTGNWSDTAHWSTSTGGTGGASVPTSADNTYFDANSFTAAGQTVTVNTAANCLDMDWTGATNSPTFSGTSSFGISIYGSFTLISSMNISVLGSKTFAATSAGKTITTAGKTLSTGAVSFDGVGGGWILQNDFVTTGIIVLNNGSLNTNGKLVSCTNFNSSTTATRSLSLTSSIITLSGSWNFGTTTGLTIYISNSTIKLTGDSKTFAGGGLTYNNVELTGTPITISGSNTFNDLKFTAGKTVNITAGTTQTITSISGVGAGGKLITLQSTVPGTRFTISKPSGNVNVDYYSIKDCATTGGASFYARHSVDNGNNQGWTFIKSTHLFFAINF